MRCRATPDRWDHRLRAIHSLVVPWELSPGVRWTAVDDGIVVYTPLSERFFDLTGSAAELFAALAAAEWHPEVAVRHLLHGYWMAEAMAEGIVRDYFEVLEENGILSTSGTSHI